MSADDIAAHLGVTKDTVYTWIAEKAMPAHKIGRLWKFQASEIDDWVRRGGAASSSETAQSGWASHHSQPSPSLCRWHPIT
nr:helix-turn-helix domain-containing protein [Microlunatus panaciterrae]